MLPYRNKIIKNTAEILKIKKDQIFIKGKSYEKIGEIGRGEAGFSSMLLFLLG
ncbi:MAG: 2-C-methyl-D-erythritol 2,4-cyclodiphosphate synthase [Persephonella sp.]|nr:2-C-methyl-D-erythritol 2,4-cyclodiphosphate synthase [Persephonella sp.]